MSFSATAVTSLIGDNLPTLKLTKVAVYCNLDPRSRTIQKVEGLSYRRSTDFCTGPELPLAIAEKVLASILLQSGWMRCTNLEDPDEVLLIPTEVH